MLATHKHSAFTSAGRSAKQAFLYTEIAEGMNAYGVSKHRHMPEIEQVTRCCDVVPQSSLLAACLIVHLAGVFSRFSLQPTACCLCG